MPLHDLDAFVDQELGGIGLGGGAAVPSAWTTATGFLCGLEGGLGVGMGNPSARVFWRIVPACPDVIRHLGDGRGKEMGVMRVHAPKGNPCLCQTVAGAARLLFRSGTGGTGGTEFILRLSIRHYCQALHGQHLRVRVISLQQSQWSWAGGVGYLRFH